MQTIGRYFDRFWNWIVYSSVNPLQISSTIKYGFAVIGTLLSIAFGIGHIAYPSAEVTALVDPTIQAAQEIILGLATLGTVISGIRKIYMTITKKNIQTAPPTISEVEK